MASDKGRLGSAIVAALKSAGYFPSTASSDQESKAIAEWTVVGGEILKELQNHMDIVLSTGDISISPGSFMSSGSPVTGSGSNSGRTLSGKLL